MDASGAIERYVGFSTWFGWVVVSKYIQYKPDVGSLVHRIISLPFSR